VTEKSKDVYLGMGAIVHEGGVAFRVWAPHADAVFVKGTFNNWSESADPMKAEEHGTWYTDIPHAKVGDEYKFVLISGNQKLERMDPYARQVTNSAGNCVIYDPKAFDWEGDRFELPPFNELVIYEMHIGSFFADSDKKPGDFDSAAEKMDHLKRLGVNAIQVMPVAEFAGDYSWGYNPANIFAVESAYGGPDGFKKFIREAHQRGFAVIQDVVYNHFGPGDLSLWQFDGWQENGKGGIYFYNDDRSETPWGSTRPDYGRGEVRSYILDNVQMWLEEYHVDGLRFDSTLYIRTIDGSEGNDLPDGWSLLQAINEKIRAYSTHVISIAEDLRSNEWITKEISENGAGFHAQWDANFVHPVRDAVTVADDSARSMDVIRNAVQFKYENDAFRRVIYSESHDEVANGKARVPQEINPDDPTGVFAQKRSTLAAGLVFTAPGIPMLFQGQEFLEGDYFRDDVPLDWDLNTEFSGIVRLYRDLIRLRSNQKNQTRGLCGQFLNVFHVNEEEKVLAFQRWDQHGTGDDVIAVFNFGNAGKTDYVIGLPTKGIWKLRLNSDAKIYSKDFEGFFSNDTEGFEGGKDGFDFHGSVNIGPYSLLIFSQERNGNH
jgi:1,4-alpha-glucan branching enzyme